MGTKHLNIVRSIMTEERHDEQVAENHIRSINTIKKAAIGDKYVVLVQWERVDGASRVLEPVSRIWADAPAILKKKWENPPSCFEKECAQMWRKSSIQASKVCVMFFLASWHRQFSRECDGALNTYVSLATLTSPLGVHIKKKGQREDFVQG